MRPLRGQSGAMEGRRGRGSQGVALEEQMRRLQRRGGAMMGGEAGDPRALPWKNRCVPFGDEAVR